MDRLVVWSMLLRMLFPICHFRADVRSPIDCCGGKYHGEIGTVVVVAAPVVSSRSHALKFCGVFLRPHPNA
jgi:hypothetical protein